MIVTKIGNWFRNRKREKELKAKDEEACQWLKQKMNVTEPVDDTYEKEILPRLSVANFAFENRELNQVTDPWVSATEKWFSSKKA